MRNLEQDATETTSLLPLNHNHGGRVVRADASISPRRRRRGRRRYNQDEVEVDESLFSTWRSAWTSQRAMQCFRGLVVVSLILWASRISSSSSRGRQQRGAVASSPSVPRVEPRAAAMTALGLAHNNINQHEQVNAGGDMTTFYYSQQQQQQQSFGQVARELVPAWYDEMVKQLDSTLHPNIQPDQVYVLRKTVLKTRDLLDIFGPVYPNSTTTNTNTSTGGGVDDDDLWYDLRHYVAMLYRTLGTLQDLHNCHVRYTPDQVHAARKVVLQWATNFTKFRQAHPDLRHYLSHPTTTTTNDMPSSFVHKQSHLFWQGITPLPSSADPVTPALQTLARQQMCRAQQYYNQSLTMYSSILEDDEAHEVFHNFRKELRSLTDEYDLLSTLIFASSMSSSTTTTTTTVAWMDIEAAFDVLKDARKRLGAINDDWTARDIYIQNDEYPDEQERLKQQIEQGWTSFQAWTKQGNFAAARDHLQAALSPPVTETYPSLVDFLQACRLHPSKSLVIGNEAGDADSIISAISLAYIESTRQNMSKTPLVSISQADLDTQRPEVKLLLDLAGISNPNQLLFFIDSPAIADYLMGAQVTLVDHNVVRESFANMQWIVSEIVDHHRDDEVKCSNSSSCYPVMRTIAFANGKALVASTCTLVAERLKQLSAVPYPASVALLLLGVILLDSGNMAPQMGKVTQRDRDAVADLLQNTAWHELPQKSKTILGMNSSSTAPDSTILFSLLEGARYDPIFWESLSVRDALRLDYKDFPCGVSRTFGISSVLTPMNSFFEKPQIVPDIRGYMEDMGIEFLGIMFAYYDKEGRLHRQLVICGTNGFAVDDMALFLSQPWQKHHQASLELGEVKGLVANDTNELKMRFFIQRNVEPSRKQIGPLIQEFFKN